VATIVIVLHPERDSAVSEAKAMVDWLTEAGHALKLPRADAERIGHPELGVADDAVAGGADVAVSLGGDGTMLRTIDLVASGGVPVLGVNHGQLGYLTEVQPEEMRSSLERIFAGDYGIEHRMMLDVQIESSSGGVPLSKLTALNEAVLEKTNPGRTIRLDVILDGERFTPYAADGLIVATPTGSTAYAFSARGPIVAPEHRAILLTPVSPHMLFDRTLVLEPDSEVRLVVSGDRGASLTVDGRVLGELAPGEAIVCSASTTTAQLVTFGPRDFHRILKTKFGLADR
jgi:NAD+ kinase